MKTSATLRNIRLGIKTLMLHKLRSLLTVLGVTFGVGSVIAMLAVGEGASKQAMDQIRKLGSNNIILRAKKPIEDSQSSSNSVMMSFYGLTYEDDERIRATLPSVAKTVPAKEIRKEARFGQRTLELRVMGTTPDWFDLVGRSIEVGRRMNWVDMQASSAVCVLTELGARKLLATQHAVGQSIYIGPDSYTVIGIVRSEGGGGTIQTPDQDIDAYIPLNVARGRYGDMSVRATAGSREMENVELHLILAQVRDSTEVEATAGAIQTMLQRFHKRVDYAIDVPLALLKQAEETKRTFNIVLGAIAGISLLVGGIGIMNIMLASVTERTREIGVRRAIGAKRRQIVGQFLIETTVLSFIGGLIGIMMGLMLPWIITFYFAMPTVVPVYGVVLALCISVGIGIVFGLYPAARAAKLDPIEALRHE